ncbi:AraC family transcriptional regulator [Ruminococcus sp. OA3]|uniref:AraC family transcriptional regulator n=1 Tax=Ruminococcus sp. OA3 TaxID=2914164 RepID=UPI001F068672|nr:AraC family transcriptional regulator [Ruminococcus sp. OA3]MCH1981064.1 AraC family transcriptional regulator [Ruminococcus sp. OA3]
MSIEKIQEDAVIPVEPGILQKKGGGFHSPSQFARQNLFCVLWGDEYICDIPYKVRRSYLDTLVLFRIVDGEMYFEYRDKSFTATSGDVVFLDARYPHYYKALGPLRLQTYMVTGNCSQAYFDMLYKQHGVHFLNRAKTSFLFNYLQNEISGDFPNDHKLSFLVHNILSVLTLQESSAVSAPVAKAQEYMLSHYHEPISLSDIADHASLSQYHFSRMFKNETGCAPYEHLTSIRIRHAKQLLTETRSTIEVIAIQCGFSSSSHFIRTFKKITGTTPAMFRKFFDPEGFKL